MQLSNIEEVIVEVYQFLHGIEISKKTIEYI